MANNPKQNYPAAAGLERDLNYDSRGRGNFLGDTMKGYGDFKGNGCPEDNSQDNDVQGEGYSKKGTWNSGSGDSIKSNKQPTS